jgi:uncharacterized Fe-S center protein
MSEVYLFKYALGEHPLEGLRKLFKAAGFAAQVKKGQSVVIKLHMGSLHYRLITV